MAVFLFARINSRNVRYWHKADNPAAPTLVRFWTIADKGGICPGAVCPLMTQSGHPIDSPSLPVGRARPTS
jgi:hypothetical protein